jgi:hypothetical protein
MHFATGEIFMKPVKSVEEALQLVDSFVGRPDAFQLAVPDALLDPVGGNMAIITDRILARGWQPDVVIQGHGHRVFRYKELI